MTDVTGFGLLGHLSEMAEGSGLSAKLIFINVPVIDVVQKYLDAGCVPGGTNRNWKSYGHNISPFDEQTKLILADPQTSGGLLVAVHPAKVNEFKKCMADAGFENFAMTEIGEMVSAAEFLIEVI